MAYQKTNWQDTLRDAQGNVIQKGTPLNAQALGKIEEGIVQTEQKINTEIGKVTMQLAQSAKNLELASGVNYQQFGAKGDGISDDSIAIKKTHDYANANNVPVVNLTGEYWLKTPNNIIIQTDVQWGNTKFHIDESKSSAIPRFTISSKLEPFDIVFDSTTKASFLSKLKPGQTLISELAPYKNCLVDIQNSNDRIGIRYGSEGHTGWAREEFFYVEERGRLVGDIAWTFTDYTTLKAYPCDERHLVIDGGSFYLNGEDNLNASGYVNNGFVIKRSRTTIRNQFVGLEDGNSDNLIDFVNGFYMYNTVYDATLENIRIFPRVYGASGTYGIGGGRVLNFKLKNVTAEGGSDQWGILGTNLIKNFYVENCTLNRVDVHFHCWNLYIKDSEIGHRGLTLSGGGDLFIENTKVIGTEFIHLRQDYGARWIGDIDIKKCRLVIDDGTKDVAVFHSNPANFDYKYPIGYGRSIKIEDFTLDFSNFPISTSVARMMSIASFSKTTNGSRLIFPNHIEFKNIKVVGRNKGIRIVEIKNPASYDLLKEGSYDGHKLVPNCFMHFENIQSEKVPVQGPQSLTHVNFLIDALGTTVYADNRALHPKVEFINCGDFFGHTRGSIADLYFNGCTINCVDAYEGGNTRGKIIFENCLFKADVTENGQTFFSNSTAELGSYFINCTIDAPIVSGVVSPNLVDRYGFININHIVRGNHLNTKLTKAITNSIPIEPEFIRMLASHHESETIYMARKNGTTANRPVNGIYVGMSYFDTTLGKTIWCKATGTTPIWVDATGTTV